jgi:prophage regulatory protein
VERYLTIIYETERYEMKSIKIYRQQELCETLGISKSTLYRLRLANNFPVPIQLSINAIGWQECDIEEWIAKHNVNHQT